MIRILIIRNAPRNVASPRAALRAISGARRKSWLGGVLSLPRGRGGSRPCGLLGVKYIDSMDVREAARAMGRRGGRARARRLTAERRRQIASLGGRARQRSLLVARRIDENLRYAAAVLELRGAPPTVLRVKAFRGPLPGIYPDAS